MRRARPKIAYSLALCGIYSSSVANLAGVTLASDVVFSDGSAQQLATVSGNVNDGYVAQLTIAVAG